MTKADKQLERMRRNPVQIRFDELRTVAERHAFVLRSVRGSHYQFRHDCLREILTVSARPPVKPMYVKEVIRLIEKLSEEEES